MATLYYGTSGDDVLSPLVESGDTVRGLGGDDRIEIRDTLEAGVAVSLSGGDGNDILYVSRFEGTGIRWFGGDGIDTVRLGNEHDNFDMRLQTRNVEHVRGYGNDTILGTGRGETIDAGYGLIRGRGGDDYIETIGRANIHGGFVSGGRGNDTLEAHARFTILKGGEGDDTFVFTSSGGKRRITDFTPGEDVVDLSEYRGGVALVLEEFAKGVRVFDGDEPIVILKGLTLAEVSHDDILL